MIKNRFNSLLSSYFYVICSVLYTCKDKRSIVGIFLCNTLVKIFLHQDLLHNIRYDLICSIKKNNAKVLPAFTKSLNYRSKYVSLTKIRR